MDSFFVIEIRLQVVNCYIYICQQTDAYLDQLLTVIEAVYK